MESRRGGTLNLRKRRLEFVLCHSDGFRAAHEPPRFLAHFVSGTLDGYGIMPFTKDLLESLVFF